MLVLENLPVIQVLLHFIDEFKAMVQVNIKGVRILNLFLAFIISMFSEKKTFFSSLKKNVYVMYAKLHIVYLHLFVI